MSAPADPLFQPVSHQTVAAPGRLSRAVHYLFISLYRSGPEPTPHIVQNTILPVVCISFALIPANVSISQ